MVDWAMNQLAMEQTVREWFSRTGGGGLVLPSGWFGRPYDNIHRLMSITQGTTGSITLLLDDHIQMTFDQLKAIRSTDSELVFEGFSTLNFEWQEYGSGIAHKEHFGPGSVSVVAPPGA